jgi:gamma-glutamyltranspeptidase
MDYVTASSMEWMEMDARTIHFHAMDTWTVDVEWIASLVTEYGSKTMARWLETLRRVCNGTAG